MTIFALELYDKDNDVYDIIAYSSDLKELMLRGKLIEHLVNKDMIVRHCSDGTKEPYDSVNIRKLDYSEGLSKFFG